MPRAREVAATIISAEEQLRGWLAQIHRAHSDPHAAIPAYDRLQRRLEFYASWLVLPWDEASADLFLALRSQRVRIGPMDLKIACIAITRDATLLSRNKNDFSRVLGLRFDNWLD